MSIQRPNIKDIAKRCGVHPSTVSRVLNTETRSMVSDKVSKKVLNVAAEIGYRRNPLASGLRTRRSLTIGVLIPDLTNPLFPPIVRGIERSLASEGYIAILADTDNSEENERSLLEIMQERQVDGMILATAHRRDPLIEDLLKQKVPLVLVNRTVDRHKVTSVVNDDAHGIKLAVEHLFNMGHRRIAYVGGPQNTSTGYARYRAFLSSIKAVGLNLDENLMINGNSFSENIGHETLSTLLNKRKKITAVIAANDLLALGCYEAIKEKGFKCPDDISVTGYNDMPYIDRFSPPLTTLRIPHDELGAEAGRLLLEQLKNTRFIPQTIKLKPSLIIRGSTTPMVNNQRD